MDILDSIILGVIQGLTEFLPVSSSGHLELGKAILGDDSMPQDSLMFTVVLHFATALSTLVVFRKDIFSIFKSIFSFQWNDDTQLAVKIIISMIPAVIVGFQYESILEELFGGSVQLVGFMLLITAFLLFLADKAKDTGKKVTYRNAFIIGLAQAIAMLPGISRSGATISASVLLGTDKTRAARFSFLMVVPLIFGKICKDILTGELTYDSEGFLALSAGFVAAFVTGLIACTWMISIVKKSKLIYFAIYCLIIGLIAIIFSSLN